MPTNGSESNLPHRQPQALGRATGRGFSWLTISLVVGKSLIFLALIVLGWILTEADIGVFAIAASVIGFIKIFHDGGIPQVLVQRGEGKFERLQGAAFWIVMTISTVAGIALAGVAPWIAEVYDDQRLIPMLLVLAVTLPLGAPANLLRARLQLDLRFRIISIIATARFAIRSLGMIVLALLGFGVMSFVLPLIVTAVFEGVANYLVTRAKPWSSPVRFKEWPALLWDSYWVVFAAICRGMARYGGNLVLGLLLAKPLLGLYFYGYQLTIQVNYLVVLNLRHVLFPVMTKLADQPERQGRAILRTIRVLMLVAAPTSLLLAAIIRPLAQLVLHQKWAPAVPLMQVFAVMAPLLIISEVVQAALSSRGQFRRAGYLNLLEGCWLLMSCWLAVKLAGDTNITGVAAWSISLQATYVLAVSALVLTTFQIRPLTFLRGLLTHWSVALIAAAAAMTVGQILPQETSPVIQILLLTIVYFVSFSALAQLLLRSDLQELANVAPHRIAGLVRILFLLRRVENTSGGG